MVVMVRVKPRQLWAPSLAIVSGAMLGAADWICRDYVDEESLIGAAALPPTHGRVYVYIMHKAAEASFELWGRLKRMYFKRMHMYDWFL